MFQISSFKKNADSIAAAAAGFFIIFLFTRHGGIGVCPDGVVYLSTAENFHSNGKLVDFTPSVLVNFPAFYPLFLSTVMLLTGLKPLLFAPVLNSLLFAAVIYVCGYIMEQFLFRSKWYKRAVLSCLILSPCLLEVYSMVWSETVFMLLLLLFMVQLQRYFQSYSRKALIAAAVFASLAAVTRYAGVTIIASGGILLLLNMQLPLKRKFTDLVIYSVISPLLLIANLMRNYFINGTSTGMREKSIRTLSGNLNDAGVALADWLPFLHGHSLPPGWLIVVLIAGLAFICLQHFWRHRRLAAYENIAAFFSLFYILFLIATATISRFEILNSRLLSPLFIPVLWCGSSWIVAAIKNAVPSARKRWTALGIIIFFSFQYNQLAADYETWDGVKDAGIPGYTEDQWRYSATVQFIQKDSLPFQKGHTIYSNANDALYFFMGRPGKYLPHKDFEFELQRFLNDRHCYVVWFNDGEDADLVGLDFITRVKKMKLVKQFNDGAIYEYDE